MNKKYKKNKSGAITRRLVNVFLLFRYSKMTDKQKNKLNAENIPELVFYTTKIEEPWVTRNDVQMALKKLKK